LLAWSIALLVLMLMQRVAHRLLDSLHRDLIRTLLDFWITLIASCRRLTLANPTRKVKERQPNFNPIRPIVLVFVSAHK
jgi:hypothetical protein